MGKRANKTWSKGNQPIGIRLSPELRERTDTEAKRNGTTAAEWIRNLILKELDRIELNTD